MKTITFYSYKGGVGRSLALVNIATRLAEFGKKVCIIDFDLEAPGLHLKFPMYRFALQRGAQKGIVDYVYEFSNKGLMPDGIESYSKNIFISRNGSPISLIPAGNSDSFDYWKKLSSINWYELIYENENGLAFFLHLKESIKKEINPDFLLIDSRTGISEMSGITLSLLAEEVVIVAANNKENLGGAKKIINSITDPKNSLFGRIPKITFVLSRIPFTDKPEDKAKELLLVNRIKREYLLPKINDINIIHSDRELEENERIKIAYEKDESTAQSSRDYLSLFEKITVNDLSENEIRRFKNIRESERLLAFAKGDIPLQQKLELITKAIELNKSNIDLYIFRANVYKDLEDFKNAKEDITNAFKLNENYIPAHELLISVLNDSKHYEEALEKIDSFLKINPTNIFALTYRGSIYTKIQEYQNAENAFTELIISDPEYSTAYAGRGNVRRLKGELGKALEDVYKALELDSENVEAVATLAEIHAQQGDIGAFYIHIENAMKIDSKYMGEVINEESIYNKFLNEDRFLTLLSKYDIFPMFKA
jgi:MinD-like ATPase involved in chromosome partitioning or flagellar assembly